MRQPKPEPARNPRLLAMARGKPCLVRLNWCDGGGATTVAAHSNSLAHGKGMGLKAGDAYSTWCCFSCHHQLDQGPARQSFKDAAFARAHQRQVAEWERIAQDPQADPRDAAAARWALSMLGRSSDG